MTMRTAVRLLIVVAMSVGRATAADEAPKEPTPPPPAFHLDSVLTAGYRNVDIDGSRDKYREDYNLRSGGRLFDFAVSGRATDQDAEWVDRFHLEVETPHDEPVSHFVLTASNANRYDLRASWVRSTYFYEVPRLFEEPVPGDVRLDDLHDFDTHRSDGTVDLRIRLTDTATLIAGYRLYRRYGDSVTTLFVPGGDTFLVRAPVDSNTNVGRLGAEFEALGAQLLVQQEYRHVGRQLDQHGPDGLPPQGVDPTDPSTLIRQDVQQDDTIDAPTTTVRVRRPIGTRGEIVGAYVYQHAELSADQTSFLNATRDSPTVPPTDRSSAHSEASVDTQVADLQGSWQLLDRLGLHVSYRFDEQQQDGSLEQVGTGGPLQVKTNDHVRINRVTGEFDAQPRDDLRLRAGIRWAGREASLSTGTSNVHTSLLGAIADVRYRPWTPLSLFARYESASIDDPYATAGAPLSAPPLPGREISLTLINRASGGFRLRAAPWAQLMYTFTADDRANSSFDAHTQAYGNTLGVALEPLPALSIYLGYTHRSLASHADILTAPTYDTLASVQDGQENVVDATLAYGFDWLGQRWSSGANLIYVDGNQKLAPKLEPGAGTHTFYDLNRLDTGAFLTLQHRWLEPSVEVRFVDYDQHELPRNDYQATIVTVKLTKRWGQ